MENAQSFTARRPAASNLPNFQLPELNSLHKFGGYSSTANTSQPPVSSVLTPPAALNDGLSPLSSSVNSGSSQSSSNGVPPYNPMGFWPGPPPQQQQQPQQQQGPAYGSYSQPSSMPSPFAQNPMYMGRQLYSPTMNFPGQQRNSNSPTTGEGLPAPPYDLNLPPFPTSLPMNGSSGGQSNLPTLAPQQQQQQMANAMMNSQQPASQSAQTPASMHAPENYGARPPPTPTYQYAPSSAPQQASFPAFTQASPTQHSPNPAGGAHSRISPVSANHPPMQPPLGHYQQRPYSGYPLPAMSGPIMSNVHSPGSQMSLVGGMGMQGYPQQHMGHSMYGHPGQQQQQNDRPFKCDQCPQSFNRNHDLKRHKRIHLAVKPFPCGHCEKSFSRKDALKRHILVKGCGKSGHAATGSQSPLDRSEIMSDDTDDSPEMPKKEL